MPKLFEYDGVVIGAGHNGMICAGYLAKCGQKIMVVEKNMEVGGGLTRTRIATIPASGTTFIPSFIAA